MPQTPPVSQGQIRGQVPTYVPRALQEVAMTYSGSFPPNPVTGQRVMRSDAGAPSGVGEYVYINGAWLFIGPAAVSSATSITLGATFTIPAVGATGSMTVAGLYPLLEEGSTILINAPSATNMVAQPWIGQVTAGGGTTALTVVTISLGTFSAAGTIASGTEITWGTAATTYSGTPPSFVNMGTASLVTGTSYNISLSGAPSVGNTMVLFITGNNAGVTITPPVGWTAFPGGNGAGSTNSYAWSYYRNVQAGDGTTYAISFSSTSIGESNAFIGEMAGGNFALMQAAFFFGGLTQRPTTPPIVPFAPNSFVVGFFVEHNAAFDVPPPGWTQIAFATGAGSTNQLAVNAGPLTTTTAIQGQTYWGGTDTIAGMIIVPPLPGSGSFVPAVQVTAPIVNTGTPTNPNIGLGTNVPVSDLAPGTSGQFLETIGGVATWSAGGGSGGGGTFTSSGIYTIPAVGSSGTINLTANWAGVSPAVIQFATTTAPFIGLVTAGGGTTALTVQTLQVGGSSTIPSGSTGAWSGYPPSSTFTYQDYDTYITGLAHIYAHWPLNELSGTTMTDAGPNGLNGTYVTSTVLGVGGPCYDGKTGVFLGNTLAASLSSAALTSAPNTAYTFLYWANFTNNPQNNSSFAYPIPAYLGNTTLTNGSITLAATSGSSGGVYNCELVGSATKTAAGVPMTTGAWQLCATTWDGTTVSLWRNAVLEATIASAGATLTAPGHLYLGNYAGGSVSTTFYGNLAKVSVFSAALTEANLVSIYNVGRYGHT